MSNKVEVMTGTHTKGMGSSVDTKFTIVVKMPGLLLRSDEKYIEEEVAEAVAAEVRKLFKTTRKTKVKDGKAQDNVS